MNTPGIQPTSRFHRTLKIFLVLLVLSFVLAISLVNSGFFWSFISWLPQSFAEGFIGFLNSALSPIQPVDVHEQEGNIEFITAWCFLITALIMLYLSFVLIRKVFYVRTGNAL